MLKPLRSFGDRLKYARKVAGMTQTEVARYVGVSPQAIQAIEANTSKRSSYTMKIAEAVGVDASWLAQGAPLDPPNIEDSNIAILVQRALASALPKNGCYGGIDDIVKRQMKVLDAIGIHWVYKTGNPSQSLSAQPTSSED